MASDFFYFPNKFACFEKEFRDKINSTITAWSLRIHKGGSMAENIKKLIAEKNFVQIKQILGTMNEVEISDLIEGLSDSEVIVVFRLHLLLELHMCKYT